MRTDPVFLTERLVVRPYTEEDASFVLDMYGRWEVQEFLGPSPRPLSTVDEAHGAIQRWRAIGDSNPLLGFWAVALQSGELVGTVMLKMAPLSAPEKPLPLSDEHEVGWHLHPEHWGHGYASEATAGALRRAFDAGVEHVVALIHPKNQRSIRVAERLRMRHVGLTDRYYSMRAELYRTKRDDQVHREA